MHRKIKRLNFQGKTNKNDLLNILQENARKLGLSDIIRSSLYLHHDAVYIQASYRAEYLKAYINGFLLRIREVKEDKLHYTGTVDMRRLNYAIKHLEEQEKMMEDLQDSDPAFFQIYKIISLYTTFIKGEPIHQVGTPFPGGLTVKKKGNKFLCPVKKNNEDNPLAVCPFCIAEQDEEI